MSCQHDESFVFPFRSDVQIPAIRFAFTYNNTIARKISDAFADSFTVKVVETGS